MPEVIERIEVAAPPERLWTLLTDWPGQGAWMMATDVRTVDGPANGVGGRLRAVTGLPLPGRRRLGVVDTMVITKWQPPRLVEVQHTGRIVRGPGRFELFPQGERTALVCTETWYLPFGPLGRLGWLVSRPFVVWGLRLSLRRFAGLTGS